MHRTFNPTVFIDRFQNELKAGDSDHWFAALWATTDGVDPVPEADRGKIRKMAEARNLGFGRGQRSIGASETLKPRLHSSYLSALLRF
jgi:hypothetical protein